MIITAQKRHFLSYGEKPASFWTNTARLFSDALSALLRLCLYAFRLLRPLLGPRACRFVPTCTQYAGEALAVHGPFYGSYLAARRVAKCHPFHPGGWDPVPPKTV